jgi:hypothetical protein
MPLQLPSPPVRSLPILVLLLTLTPGAAAQTTSALRIGALRSDARTPLALSREVVEIECEAPAAAEGEDPDAAPMPCTLRARYVLENPDAESHAASLRFTVENATDPFEVGDEGAEGRAAAPTLGARRFPFDPGASRTLELVGPAALVRSAPPGLPSTEPIRARHPVLATGPRSEVRGFVYSRAVTRHFVSAPENVVIRARLPEGRHLHVDGDDVTVVSDGSADGWQEVRVHRPDSEADAHITIEIREGGDDFPIRHGGPFLALGGVALAPTGVALESIFWARLGYEIGIVDFLVLSVSAETDFADRFAVGAMLEAASPSFGIPPSFSVGIGTAIRALPQPTAGLRLSAGLTVYSVGFEALFDYFPSEGGFTITLLGRAGL